MKPTSKLLDTLTIACFLAAIVAPGVDLLLRPAAARSPRVELREAAPLPELDGELETWIRFPEAFQSYHDDSFGLRDKLLRWHNALRIFVLGTTPSARMVLGKQHWIFSTVERSMEVYRGVAPLAEKELEYWRLTLESRRDWLAQSGIEYVFALAPSKQEVYPERMPARFTRVGPTRVDQLARYLGERSDVRFVDLRAALERAKARDDGARGDYAYYPLGTHWTLRGAAAAVEDLLGALAPDLAVRDRGGDAPFGWAPVAGQQGDSWAARLYLADRLRQTVWRPGAEWERARAELRGGQDPARRLRWYEQDDPGLPRALVLHDSFGQAFFELLPRFFSRTCFVWTHDLDPALIRSERPDVVLQVYVDRTLISLSPVPLGSAGLDFAREQFERSDEVLLRVDMARNEPAIEEYRNAPLSTSAEDLVVEVAPAGGMLLLPAFEFPERRSPVLHCDLTSPEDTVFDLFYQTRAEPVYKRTRLYKLPIRRGRNSLYIELLAPDLAGRIMLRPGRDAGRYSLHALEVRAVGRR